MGALKRHEYDTQARFKMTWPAFSAKARQDGFYTRKAYPFCLPRECAEENLCEAFRREVLAEFAALGIAWHKGGTGTGEKRPSNHMLDSQVCCVNMLHPLGERPELLATALRTVFPELVRPLPVERGRYLAFEYIGSENYLGEHVPHGKERTRGANCTSIDAMALFEDRDSRKTLVLIEWKYTESYTDKSTRYSKRGTDRLAIYRPLLESPDCPIRVDMLPSLDALFHDPFDQLMRQQLLAHQFEKHHELGADTAVLLQIAPRCNRELQKVTSPGLRELDATVTGVWSRLQRRPDRFRHAHQDELFGDVLSNAPLDLHQWREYVCTRYATIVGSGGRT